MEFTFKTIVYLKLKFLYYQWKGLTLKSPNKAVEEFELFDNGVPADIAKNDGIYSRYFTSSTSAGRYTLYCLVKNNGTAFIPRSGIEIKKNN